MTKKKRKKITKWFVFKFGTRGLGKINKAQLHRRANNFREEQQGSSTGLKAQKLIYMNAVPGAAEKGPGHGGVLHSGHDRDAAGNGTHEAGPTSFNHNLDTSREYYPNIFSTRSYDERLECLTCAQEAGINVCSGGIIGLGEAEEDRVGLLHTLATLPEHPENVPIDALFPSVHCLQ